MKGQTVTTKGIELLNSKAGSNIFPLQTIQSMAERWGVSRQYVNSHLKTRDAEFPTPLDGLIAHTARTPQVYALCDVERFEQLRGLMK